AGGKGASCGGTREPAGGKRGSSAGKGAPCSGRAEPGGGNRAPSGGAADASHADGGGGTGRSRVATSCSPVAAGCGSFAAAWPQLAQNRAPCFSSLPHSTQKRR